MLFISILHAFNEDLDFNSTSVSLDNATVIEDKDRWETCYSLISEELISVAVSPILFIECVNNVTILFDIQHTARHGATVSSPAHTKVYEDILVSVSGFLNGWVHDVPPKSFL